MAKIVLCWEVALTMTVTFDPCPQNSIQFIQVGVFRQI